MSRRLRTVLQALSVAVVVGLLAILAWRLATERRSPAKGAAPDFTLPRLDQKGNLKLASLRGKAVVLNFWASWCAPCKQEAPDLQAAYRTWKGQDVVFVGIDGQDFSSDARRFMKKYDVTYPVVRDGPGGVVSKYGVTGFPETFFLDRRGRIVGDHISGPASREALDRNIRQALAS